MAKLDVNVNQLNSDIQGIKSAIIEANVEVPDGTPTSEYGGLVGSVYEAGAKSEYDRFWDIYQKNGERTNYSYGFANEYWTDDTFKPKYPFKLVGGGNYFMRTGGVVWADKILELDTSEATNLTQAFYNCKVLSDITILSTTPPTLVKVDAFYNCTATLHVYGVDAYKSADVWKDLNNEFVEIVPEA